MFIFDKIRSNKLLTRFVFSYIFILLIPLLMGLHGYQTAAGIVKQDIQRSNLSMLNQAKDVVDNQLQQVETLSMQISSNLRVNSLLHLKGPLKDSDYFEFRNAIQDVSRYMANINIINSFYIYLANTNYVITPETLYTADLYYDMVLKYNKEDYETWKEMMIGNYYAGKYMKYTPTQDIADNSPYINYVQSLPLSYGQKVQGALAISLKKENMTKLFSTVNLTSGGWVYIQAPDGQIIASVSGSKDSMPILKLNDLGDSSGFNQKRVADEDMIITYTTSDYNKWKYVMVLPSNVVLKKLNNFQLFSWVVFLITLLIGIVIACFLAYQNSKPVLNVMKQLKDFMGDDNARGNDAFSIINGGVSQLIANNKVLQEDINNKKPIIQAAFLDKLLKGHVYNKAELTAMSSYVGVDIRGNKHAVLLARLYNNDSSELNLNSKMIEEFNISKALVRGVLTECFQDRAIIHDYDHRTISLILNCDTEDQDGFFSEMQDILNCINVELVTTYNLKVFFGGGEAYSDLLDIWHSLEQAEQALNYPSGSDNCIVWYENIPKDSDTYYYPLDLEQRIINHSKAGDKDQVKKLLQIIYTENFETRSLSIHMGKELLYELKSTLVKLMSQLSDEATVKKLMKSVNLSDSVETSFKVMGELYEKACEIVLSQKSNQSTELMTNIKKYIETNYMHQDLSLYKVSSHFNLSEGYFSHLFKEQSGVNFTDYLEKVRMDSACELLKNKDLNINDIAEMVGYNSAQSFRRAFKRLCGVNPTALRDC